MKNPKHEYYAARSARRRMAATGMNASATPYGVSLRPVGDGEELFIRVTAQTGKQFTWSRVVRGRTGEWVTMPQTGGPGYDPAYEFNNQNAPINQVYRAYRDQNSGQLLFF